MTRTEKRVRDEWRTIRAAYGEHLAGCSLKINGRFHGKLGACRYRGGVPFSVEVAKRLTTDPALEEQALETLRHEAAHALAGYEAGHGPEWQRWARRLGARPTARTRMSDLTTDEREALVSAAVRTAKWTVDCNGCDWSTYRHRASARIKAHGRCPRCQSTLTWTDNRK